MLSYRELQREFYRQLERAREREVAGQIARESRIELKRARES